VIAGLVAGLVAITLGGTACSGPRTSSAPSTINVTETQTITASPTAPSSASSAASFTPAPATSVPALGAANAPLPKGEKEADCPYISNQAVADTEGDHVYRTAVLTTLTPHGCRFYFYAGPFEAIADILPMTFSSATEAYNAMVATGKAGKSTLGVKGLIPGVDAVLYKTTFFGPDGPFGDWACAFAKGKVMVVVHTQQTNVSYNARSLAEQLAPKF